MMLRKIWWSIKVTLFPHLERRRMPRPSKAREAEDFLATAIIQLSDALERKK